MRFGGSIACRARRWASHWKYFRGSPSKSSSSSSYFWRCFSISSSVDADMSRRKATATSALDLVAARVDACERADARFFVDVELDRLVEVDLIAILEGA